MPRPQPVYLEAFRRDLQDIVLWSEDHFGSDAADRYAMLISQALSDLVEAPVRPGAKHSVGLAPNAHIYHLMHSRDRVPGNVVKAPRHFVLYRVFRDRVEFARLLHDSSDLVRHLPEGYGAEE